MDQSVLYSLVTRRSIKHDKKSIYDRENASDFSLAISKNKEGKRSYLLLLLKSLFCVDKIWDGGVISYIPNESLH